MKILIAALIFLLAGCTSHPISDKKPEKPTVERTTVEKKVEKKPDPIMTEITLAEVSTPLLDDSAPRVENINIACGAINGIAIYPGGSFSFNNTVGNRTESRGYRDAPVLVNGHKEKGCGGGVCQVSSTIYMAALDAGLTIDERHPHSESVAYAPEGKDATVVSGEKDLRFTNNLSDPVTLYVWTDGSDVFSKITQKTLDKNA